MSVRRLTPIRLLLSRYSSSINMFIFPFGNFHHITISHHLDIMKAHKQTTKRKKVYQRYHEITHGMHFDVGFFLLVRLLTR